MSCQSVCPLEVSSRDSASPGPVSDDEAIARGAFYPSHGDAKRQKIRASIVSKKELLNDKVSVWRMGELPLISAENLIDILRAGEAGRVLFAITWAIAGDIRDIKAPPDGDRAFCILDECEMDRVGNRHPAHAHIALCQSLKSGGKFDGESPVFVQIHRDLVNLIKNEQTRRLIVEQKFS